MDIKTVFDIITEERDYQARRWGTRKPDDSFEEKEHSVGDFLVYMQDYFNDAVHAATREPEDNNNKALDALRKVVTLGIACFEQHGLPLRPQLMRTNMRDGRPAYPREALNKGRGGRVMTREPTGFIASPDSHEDPDDVHGCC